MLLDVAGYCCCCWIARSQCIKKGFKHRRTLEVTHTHTHTKKKTTTSVVSPSEKKSFPPQKGNTSCFFLSNQTLSISWSPRRAFESASRRRKPSTPRLGCRSRDLPPVLVVTRRCGPSWDLHESPPNHVSSSTIIHSFAGHHQSSVKEKKRKLTLHKPAQHPTPSLQQRVSHHYLQKPLEPSPPLLDYAVVEAVQVDFPRQGGDGDAGAFAL